MFCKSIPNLGSRSTKPSKWIVGNKSADPFWRKIERHQRMNVVPPNVLWTDRRHERASLTRTIIVRGCADNRVALPLHCDNFPFREGADRTIRGRPSHINGLVKS